MSASAHQTFLDLARAMIRQAKDLRDAGELSCARAVAERAIALKSLGWSFADVRP